MQITITASRPQDSLPKCAMRACEIKAQTSGQVTLDFNGFAIGVAATDTTAVLVDRWWSAKSFSDRLSV